MRNVLKRLFIALMLVMVSAALLSPVKASAAQAGEERIEEAGGMSETNGKALAAGIAIAVVAAAGAIAMSHAISKSAEGISRQPEAEGPIRTSLMLGLVFIETAIIYALIVAILIIFVL